MSRIADYPVLVFAISLVTLWLAARAGDIARKRVHPIDDDQREDFGVIRNAILTLLGLVVGFTFSMAVSRYDQRKNLEEEEANAIGTEYLRADLLPASDASRVRDLLRQYLEQRVLYYTSRDADRLAEIDAKTGSLQAELWSAVMGAGNSQPTPIAALVVSGMNDVLNSQGYTQAAWWNRLPSEAWALMVAIGVCGNLLLGYGARRPGTFLFLAFPLTVSIAFFLIADIDSPRKGVIRIAPQNLTILSRSMAGS
jgi:hypothetical protein